MQSENKSAPVIPVSAIQCAAEAPMVMPTSAAKFDPGILTHKALKLHDHRWNPAARPALAKLALGE